MMRTLSLNRHRKNSKLSEHVIRCTELRKDGRGRRRENIRRRRGSRLESGSKGRRGRSGKNVKIEIDVTRVKSERGHGHVRKARNLNVKMGRIKAALLPPLRRSRSQSW